MHQSDVDALERLSASAPQWFAVARARDVLNVKPRTVLHCGPPASPSHALARPILNSAAVACVYERWAPDLETGLELVASGDINFEPAQDHSVVTPMAAVVTPSMQLLAMTDARDESIRAYAPINGGGTGAGPGPRYGLCNQQCLEHLFFLNEEVAALLNEVVTEPLPWLPIVDRALSEGDDCHLRHDAAHAIMMEMFARRLGAHEQTSGVWQFMTKWPFFHLNFWMAAVRASLNLASGVANSSLVSAFGGNGREFGLRLSGAHAQHWVTVAATPPLGSLRDTYNQDDCLGALGDSALIEAFGLGAFAHRFAPQMQAFHKDYYHRDLLGLDATLLGTTHPGLAQSAARVGLLARTVVEKATTPVVELGIVGKNGKDGGLGAGLYRPPLALFQAALAEINSTA